MATRAGHGLGDVGGGLPRTAVPRVVNARVRPVPPAPDWTVQGKRALRAVPAWAVRGYLHANASDLAAAVAFNALIAVVPTFLLFASIAGFFLRDDYLLARVVDAILWARAPSEAEQEIQALVSVRQNSGWLGLVSLVGFAWIGTNFISCLARGMNRVYGVPNRKFVHERLRGFLLILVFAALFVLASFAAVVPTFFVWRNLAFYYYQRLEFTSTRVQAVSYLVAFVSAVLLFLVLYRVVPNAGQRLGDVWPGALVAAFLFVVMTQAFPLYLRFFNQYNQYAKALGIGLLLIIWFYALAHVLLFGSHVNATYQRLRRRDVLPPLRRRLERMLAAM